MVIVDTVGAHGCCASGFVHFSEVAVLVELQDILLNGLVGRVGAEVNVVAEGDSHALVFGKIACPYHLELASLAVVADDVCALTHVVAHNIAVGNGIYHGPEGIHRYARGSRNLRAIDVDQRTGYVSSRGNVDLVPASGQSPCVTVLSVAAGNEPVDLALAVGWV